MNDTERFCTFTLLVSGAYKALRRAQEKYTRRLGLRSVHVACMLQLLGSGEGLSATELSRLCGVDRAQVSRVVGELERAGLLCEAAPGGKRRYRGSLLLTDAGREQAEAMSGIVSSKLAEVSAELRADEVETFYKVFRKIADKLENI